MSDFEVTTHLKFEMQSKSGKLEKKSIGTSLMASQVHVVKQLGSNEDMVIRDMT